MLPKTYHPNTHQPLTWNYLLCMNTYAIASDYDGTIADAGRVAPSTLQALRRFRQAGHKLLLVTGREIDDLKSVFAAHDVFHLIVAENGALLYDPATAVETFLVEPPDAILIDELQRQHIGPLYIGRVIVGTLEKHRQSIQNLIDQRQLDLELILNKEAVMILPKGVNKAFGLRVALKKLHLDAAYVAGVGDAENDEDLLASCGFAVAVANALPALKQQADWVTKGSSGAGVSELIDRILQHGIQAPNTWRKAQ